MRNSSDRTYLTRAARFFEEAARRACTVGVSTALMLTLTACGSTRTTPAGGANAGEDIALEQGNVDAFAADVGATDDASTDAVRAAAEGFSIDTSDLFSARDLDASYDAAAATKVTFSDAGSTVTGEGVTVDGSVVTIAAEGTYVLSGTLGDGRVVVDAGESGKVQLVLDGVSLASSTGTALYVRSADKVFVIVAKGTANTLAATGASTEEDDHTLDGTLYACDDLTINGEGSLTITSAQGNGVVGKDELTLAGGTLSVEAAAHAIEAKDSVAVHDGTYTLVAGTDGIHVEHETNGEKGFCYIAGGTFDIVAQSDGIDASNDVLIDGGTLTIKADDDGIHAEYDLVVNDGTIDVTQSREGLEGARYEQNGGNVQVVATDDGVNASGNPSDANGSQQGGFGFGRGGAEPEGGQMPDGGESAEDGGRPPVEWDGEMPEGMQPPQDGEMADGQGRHGMPPLSEDGEMPKMPEGMTPPEAGAGQGNDAAVGTQDVPFEHIGGVMGPMDADDTASLVINGGTLVVDAGGDGLDSNGSLVVNGGETYVSGPTNNGNGALDYGTTATVTGGIVVAAGSAGMAENFGTNSTQGSMLVSASGDAGDAIELKGADGTVLASSTPTKQYSCVLISAPGIVQGGTYTLSHGDQVSEVTMDSLLYSDVAQRMDMADAVMGDPRRDQQQSDTTTA